MFPIGNGVVVREPTHWLHAVGAVRLLGVQGTRWLSRGLLTSRKIQSWQPHLIHAHFGNRGWNSLVLKRQLGVSLVTSFYGYDAWKLPESAPVWRQRYLELFEECDAFLVEGSAMKRRLQDLGCAGDKIRIHRIGVDLTALPFQRRERRKDLRVIMVGRFVEKKGFVDGLRACALAASEGTPIDVTIVGDASSNDSAGLKIKEQLQVLAESRELVGHVRFAGFIPLEQTRAALSGHDVLLCPSKHATDGDAEGGSPVILTEAMALGLVCVGTSHCDIPEVILDRKTGYLCKEGDVRAIAEALVHAASSPEEVRGITASGRQYVENEYSLSKQLAKLGQVYRTIAN
jgi:colanic acid/amylovoran biosynthesis glycosyltransferase